MKTRKVKKTVANTSANSSLRPSKCPAYILQIRKEYVDTASNDYAAHAEFKLVSVCTLGKGRKSQPARPMLLFRVQY